MLSLLLLSCVPAAVLYCQSLRAELLLVQACLQRHAPFLLFQYQNPVLKRVFQDSTAGKDWACSREKACTLALHGIGPLMHAAVVELLRNNPFSPVIDESSSMGVVQHLALVFRVFSTTAGKVSVQESMPCLLAAFCHLLCVL